MDKPIVFFSHSSRDRQVLKLLKEKFSERVGGVVEIFLSSDGQSIPLGRNWVHRIEEALNESKLLVIFVTPNSVGSSWVLFEAGFAYAKGLRVVPVGFLGIEISKLPPPLGLLQGFNITSVDGLDNLIALINETFQHRHKARFEPKDYDELISLATNETQDSSAFSLLVEELDISFEPRPRNNGWEQASLRKTAEAVAKLVFPNAPVSASDSVALLHFPGGHFRIDAHAGVSITLDPLVVQKHAGVVDRITAVCRASKGEYTITVDFKRLVSGITSRHKISALVPELETGASNLIFRDFEFHIGRTEKRMHLWSEPWTGKFPISELVSLVEILADRGVIWADDPALF